MLGWVRFTNLGKEGGFIGVHISHVAAFLIPKDPKKPIKLVLAVGDGLTYEVDGTEKEIAALIRQTYRIPDHD